VNPRSGLARESLMVLRSAAEAQTSACSQM
jgi:hypothetical protein